MPKRFTLPEAESLLPELDKVLREAISLKVEFEEAESNVQAVTQRVIMMGGVLVDRQTVLENKHKRDRMGAQLKTSIDKIQEFGCVIKDLDIGLVDFPTEFRGQEVFLCWKLGETGIEFWHGVHEGFAGRKPIDRDFLEHHKGDVAN